MGFGVGNFMTVWGVEPSPSGKSTKVRLSSSKKNKETNKWEQDFSGFCSFIGKANAHASELQERDRIKLLSCDVGTTYDKEKKVTYTNFKVFDFETVGNNSSNGNTEKENTSKKTSALDDDEDDFPFA